MNYAYICTNYNNADFTVKAVRSLNAGRVPPSLIVVVDNCSITADRELLSSLIAAHDNVDVIFNEENVGYFRGLNIGIRRARAIFPSLHCAVVGNNDLEFPVDFGEQLIAAIADAEDRPVLSPYIETLDGMPQNPHVVSGISRAREIAYDLYYSNYQLARAISAAARSLRRFTKRSDEQGFATAGFIYQGYGACYILTPLFFSRFGELWAPTFLMGEEFFLSHQLYQQGYQVYYDPRIRIRHRCNGSVGNEPARRMWGLARDAHRVYRRYVKPWHRQVSGIHRKSDNA